MKLLMSLLLLSLDEAAELEKEREVKPLSTWLARILPTPRPTIRLPMWPRQLCKIMKKHYVLYNFDRDENVDDSGMETHENGCDPYLLLFSPLLSIILVTSQLGKRNQEPSKRPLAVPPE